MAGISATGVVVDSVPGAAVESWEGVAVSEGVTVDEGVFVGVGDEIGIAVAVAVTDGRASCEVDVGFTAPVDGGEAETAGAIVGVEDRAPAGESGVEVSDSDAGIAG